MNSKAGSTLPDPSTDSLGARVLHMLVFAVVFWVVCWTVAVTAVVQLGFRVFAGAPSPEITRFGAGLARYAAQVIAYLGFARDVLPFPFGDWPGSPAGSAPDVPGGS